MPDSAPIMVGTTAQPAAPPPAAPQPAVRDLRGAENPRARGHSPALDQREAAAVRAIKDAHDPAAAPAAPAAAPPAADPAAAPPNAEKHKVGAYEISESELAAMMTRQSADDLRKAQVPATPADYKIRLDAALPAGVEQSLIFDRNDPMAAATLDAARQWAHNKGLSQAEFGELLGVYANGKAAEISIINRAAAAEREKLGAMGGQRVDAIAQWVRGEVGDADAKLIISGLACAAQVTFMEKIITRLTNQGSANFDQRHRAAPDDSTIPGFAKMSFEQQRFAQDQLAARRR